MEYFKTLCYTLLELNFSFTRQRLVLELSAELHTVNHKLVETQ